MITLFYTVILPYLSNHIFLDTPLFPDILFLRMITQYSFHRLQLLYISVTAFSAVHCIEDPSVIVFIQHCKCKTQFSAHFVKSIVFDNSDLLIMCFHFFRNFFFTFSFAHKFCDFIQFIKFAENTFFKIFSVFSTHKCYITFL